MRAQASIEFMMVFIILIAAISVISAVSFMKTREIQISNLQREAGNLLRDVGGSINTVYLEGDGFQTIVSIPDKIIGFDYSISISSNYLTISVQDTSFSRALLTNATGSFQEGENTIANVDGAVEII